MGVRVEATQILRKSRGGDGAASAQLVEVVYDELRRLAASHMRRERRDHTLQPIALVHEVYVNLIEQSSVDFHDRTHFFGIASLVMRRVLVSHARKKKALKRGGDRRRVPLEESLPLSVGPDVDFIDLDEALSKLAERDERKARVIELRFFGGLTCDEVAESLGVSPKTVEADWFMARAWLHRELSRES